MLEDEVEPIAIGPRAAPGHTRPLTAIIGGFLPLLQVVAENPFRNRRRWAIQGIHQPTVLGAVDHGRRDYRLMPSRAKLDHQARNFQVGHFVMGLEQPMNAAAGLVAGEVQALAQIGQQLLPFRRVGKTLGISGREASRLLRILETPIEVQAAFDEGKISLVLANKVASLDKAEQVEVAEALRKGQDPTGIVTRHVAAKAPWKDDLRPAYHKLLKDVATADQVIAPRVAHIEVVGAQVEERVATLERGVDLLRRLIKHEKSTQRRRQKNTALALRRLGDLGEREE